MTNCLFGFITALEEEIIWTKQQLYQVSDILNFALLIVNKYREVHAEFCLSKIWIETHVESKENHVAVTITKSCTNRQ